MVLYCYRCSIPLWLRGKAEAVQQACTVGGGQAANSNGATPQRVHNHKLVLAYDGTRYNGFQLQRGKSPTVQEALERAICKVTCEEQQALRLQCAGRTDTGVHARGQVLHLMLTTFASALTAATS